MRRSGESRLAALGLGALMLGLSACGDEAMSSDGGVPTADLGADAGVAPLVGPALQIRVVSSDDLEPMPARVLISAVSPTPNPVFHKDSQTAQVYAPGVLGVSDGVFLISGQALVPIPAGTYDLTLLQGPEYEMVKHQVTIRGSDVVVVRAVLEHSVQTPGWLAADMHIHTSRSFDSKLLPVHRVISEVAAGIQLLVPTDHVWHNDLQSYLGGLGYERRAVSIPGSEYGFNPGHLGVYPVRFDPKDANWGAPNWELYENWHKLTPEVVFPMIHALPEQPLVVINHPRLLPDLGYFTNIGWPRTPHEPLSTVDLFDGMEVLNGYADQPEALLPLLRDWFFFLSQGHRIVGLGNSDTHRMDWLTSGYPRTWLRLPTDEPARVLPSDLRDALLGMRAVASTGPWLHLVVDGHEVGDTYQPTGGAVTVEIEADAASWIDLSHVLLYQDGVLVRDWSIPSATRGHPALHETTTLTLSADSWVVAMAVGDHPLPTSVIGAVQGGKTRPFALTNPVWLDFDGDGKLQPPPLLAGPEPFGAAVHLQALELQTSPAVPLHAPLDCEPDVYLEWLERNPSAR